MTEGRGNHERKDSDRERRCSEDALITWDDEDDPHGNVQHIAQNGVSMADFLYILTDDHSKRGRSRSSGRRTAWDELPDGREIIIVYEIASTNPLAIRPITAYEPED